MTFLSSQDRRLYSIFRIKHLIRNLNNKKKSMKRLSEQKTKVINQIAFYKGILQKLVQYDGENDPIFTEPEIFYISMILGMRHCYERMKQLSELRFTEDEKLHKDLQKWLCRILELDPTLFDDYLELNRFYYWIYPFSSTVESMRTNLPDYGLNQYQIWIRNIFKSFELLHNFESWRPENRFARKNSFRPEEEGCCQGRGYCDCHVENTEEIMYRIICGNVFFNKHRHLPPPQNYWWYYSGTSFL